MLTFVQIADLHLDTPFFGCSLGERAERRSEILNAFASAVCYCIEKKIDLLLICGDLFDNEFARHETVSYVADCLSRIPDTRVFITPGNHDPYNDASPYRYCSFPDNVHIFTKEALESVELPQLGCAVYGFAYRTAGMREDPVRGIFPRDPGRINILMGHGDVDVRHSQYYNISSYDLGSSGLDYVALGHIHKPSGLQYCGRTPYAYSGCLVGRDFSESGKRGMIAGEVEKGNVSIKYIPVTYATYEEIPINIEGKTRSDIINEAAELCRDISEKARVRIILEGEKEDRFFVMSESSFAESIPKFAYFKVLDRTTEKLYIKELLNEYSLRGLFANQLRPYLESREESIREKGMLALRLGLEALKK